MSDCTFCQIIRKEVSASIVYEDEQVIAFLSNRPVNEGHTLVVPKKHYENIYDIPEEEAGYLLRLQRRSLMQLKMQRVLRAFVLCRIMGKRLGK
jgi:histidine triad (HIT) family protein